MLIDEELLGYYIDCHGSWPDSFIWVFMMLFQQTMEAQAQALLEEWFGLDNHGVRKHPGPVSVYLDEGKLDLGLV